jgi:hypothetical protein
VCELLSFNGYQAPYHSLLGHDVVQSGRKYNISVGSPFTLFRMEDGHGVFSETSLRIYVSRYTVVACKVYSTNKIVCLVTVCHV